MKLTLHGQCHVDWADRQRNIEHSRALQLKKIMGPTLAVVGGGPSINQHVETLRNWRGDIWALNGTVQWCIRNGIEAALYSADASPVVAEHCVGVRRAILADICDPAAFAACPYAERFAFTARTPGPTSATTTLIAGLDAGFSRVVYFGCESSYLTETHAYQDLVVPYLIKVRCGDGEYLTEPEFLMQAEVLSAVIRSAPNVFEERSGGLLGAMVKHSEWEAVSATQAFHDTLKRNAA